MARDRLEALGGGLVVLVLVVASVAPAPYALLWPDTVRDLSASLALARGESVPLAGPPINFGPYLGPAWIWLQAPILVLATTLTAASVYVAIVGALKFVLLYVLGSLMSGRRLGLSFAVAAAIPSIAVYEWHVFWHPNWVEAAIVASLVLVVVALRRRSMGILYAAVAVLGLAIQLHVTALFYLPLHLFAFARLGTRGPRLAMHAAAAFAVIAAWFVPALFAPAAPHAAGLGTGIERVGSGLSAFWVADVLTVMKTAFIDVPLAIGATYVERVGIGRAPWIAIVALMAIVPVAGLATEVATNRDGRRNLVLAALAALLAGWTIATAIRTYTSFYLAYFLLPLGAIVAGLGLDRMVSSRFAAARYAAATAMVAIVAAFVATAIGAREVASRGYIESRLPLLMDLRHPVEGQVAARWIGASTRDAMARFACAHGGNVTLHGEWAFVVAGSTGLDFRMHCPADAAKARILGPSDNGWTLLAPEEAERIGRKAPQHFRRLAAFPVKASYHPARSRAIETEWYHFDQLRDPAPLARTSLSFEVAPGDAVTIFRLKPFTSRWENVRIERDGVAAAPAISTYNSLVFTTPGPSSSRWRIDFDTDAPQWVDVHVF